MKRLTFSTFKQTILIFEAEHAGFSHDNDAFVIEASGNITSQDTPLLEAFLHGEHACHLLVTEEGQELLSGQFFTSFLVLEQEQLVVRLTI